MKHHLLIQTKMVHGCLLYTSSDDGEPSGTAGGPMLNILQKDNLSNVLIVVKMCIRDRCK